jgi:hypothetical protein
MAGKHYHHGNSPAAWTGVIITFIGFGVGGAFTVMAEPVLALVGGFGIVALGGVVGLVMRGMGLGQAPAVAPVPAPAAAADAAEATEEVTAASASEPGSPSGEPQQATVGG